MKLGKKEINAERFSGMGVKCSAADVRVTAVPVTPGGVGWKLPLPPARGPSLSSLPGLYVQIYGNKRFQRAGHGAGLRD